MKKSLAVLLTFAMTIFFCPVSAAADDGPVTTATVGGTGVTVYPIFDTNIVMDKEIIDITVKNGESKVSCQFFFHNTGEAVNLMMGFPSEEPGSNPDQYPENESEQEDTGLDNGDGDPEETVMDDNNYETSLYDFTTTIDGKPIPVTLKEGLTPEGYNDKGLFYPDWYTWNMGFKAGEKVKVENSYKMTNSDDGQGTQTVKYILRTGAAWKGPIGSVLVRMKLEDCYPNAVGFTGMQPTYIDNAGVICWQGENIEPDEDVIVECGQGTDVTAMDSPFAENEEYYDSETTYQNDDDVNGTLSPEAQANLDNDTAYTNMSARMMKNYGHNHYRGAIWWAQKLMKRFGENQSAAVYYYMAKSYEKLHLNTKAGKAYEMMGALGYYHEANLYKKIGWTGRYIACLKNAMTNTEAFDWLKIWAKSRLADMNIKITN